MIYKATKLISEEFEKAGIKYKIDERENSSVVDAGFGVKNGPNVVIHFISRDNDNDVAVRAYSFINDIAEEDRAKVALALNKINCEYRYAKFCMDDDGDVNVEYDLPVNTPDDGLGKMCVEVFIRVMKICDDSFREIMRAII